MRNLLVIALTSVVSMNAHAYSLLSAQNCGSGLKWSSSTVTYYVNPSNGEGLLDAAVISAVRTAAAAYDKPNATLQLVYGGYNSIKGFSKDNRNTVSFVPGFDADPKNYAMTYYWCTTGRIVEFDSKMYEGPVKYYTGTSGCGSGGTYVEDVMAHELGHGVGLGHSSVTESTMYPTVTGGVCSQKARDLACDDIKGIEYLYPTSASSACSTTTTPTATAPASPSSLALASMTSTSIGLTWVDNSSNESGFKLERSTDGSTYTVVQTLPAGTISSISTGLTAGKKYWYRVRSYNSSGTSSASNIIAATTYTTTTTMPAKPLSPSPTNAATGVSLTPTLAWATAARATYYRVYFGKEMNPPLVRSTGSANSYVPGTLSSGTKYYWRVEAVNGTTNEVVSSDRWSFTTR